MVEQDVGEGGFPFGRVQIGQVDTGIGEGLVGRRKHGKGSGALQGRQQIGLDDRSDQRAVNTG